VGARSGHTGFTTSNLCCRRTSDEEIHNAMNLDINHDRDPSSEVGTLCGRGVVTEDLHQDHSINLRDTRRSRVRTMTSYLELRNFMAFCTTQKKMKLELEEMTALRLK
jgi:hypothetical protein